MTMSRWPFLPLAAIPLVLGFLRPAPSPALVWWTTHSLEKIRPYDRVPEYAPQSVKIQAARNEFEPFQVVLRAESPAIDAVDIEVTDLRGKSGVIPSAKYISVYLVRYLNLKTPSSVTGGTGEWPDPLVPRVDRYANERRNAFPFKLTGGRNQSIWVDVYVPPSTPAGSYSGQVNILVSGKPRLSIPLDLEVWNFQLPSTSSLVTTFGFSGNSAVRAHYDSYTGSKDIEDLTRVYHKAALWHRVSLDSNAGVAPALAIKDGHVKLSWDTYDSVVEPFMDGTVFTSNDPLSGARATSLAMTTPSLLLTTSGQRIEYWRQIAAHFRKKGWFDRLFHYVWDEPQPKDFPALIELGKTAHRADPALKNLVAAPLEPNWSDVIDIWSPAINCFEGKPFFGSFCNPMAERSAYDSELAKGKQLWWYQACGSHGCDIVGGDYFRGWPSYVIDDAPVRNRIMEWLTWKYGIRGELYYSTTEAYAKKDPWKDVYLFGGNGDGTLFYPGRPDVIGGTSHVPVESIRLKLIREGLEDYEYLTILSKLEGNKTVADALNRFIRHIYDYDQDPNKLYAVRESMGREISRLSTHR